MPLKERSPWKLPMILDSNLLQTGIANMQSTDLARTKTKFKVAYFVAKEELPLSKYPQLLNLEEKHGVDLGKAYRSDKSCNMFIAHIGEELARKPGGEVIHC